MNAIVTSTPAVAALFNPLRRGLQARTDRHFYRSRSDAERIVNAFAETACRKTGLGQLTDQGVSVVQATLQPERAALWLKEKVREGAR
jgi:hypothetical protein